MPELEFEVVGAAPLLHAVSPALALELCVRSTSGEAIHGLLLDCQVRLEPARRTYSDVEAEQVFELFGERERWARTQQSFSWTQVTVNVPAFAGATTVKLPLACSYDFDLASAKYLHGLDGGEIPLLLLFSGSVFYEAPAGGLQVGRVAWSKESRYRLPLAVYRQTILHYFPNRAPLTLTRDVFDRLQRFKRSGGFVSAEAALQALLDSAGASP